MRTVKFHIDDKRCLRTMMMKSNPSLTENEIESILGSVESFRCVYTLIGKGNTPDRYELVDESGNKLNINELNGYQKGCIIGACYDYYVQMGEYTRMSNPFGVVRVEIL